MKVSKINITTENIKSVFKLWHERHQSNSEEYGEMEDYNSDEYGEMTTKTFLELLKEIRNDSK